MGRKNCFLSKCRYLNGVKCVKLAWYECNRPQDIPKPDQETQAVFNWGHFIGELAREYFTNGIENTEQDFRHHLEISREWLAKNVPLFEVAYMSEDNLYARPDVLYPNEEGSHDIIEVKCNTEIHEVNVQDIAYQALVLQRAGVKIRKLFLMHPRPGIRITRSSRPFEIFNLEDVTERAETYYLNIARNIIRIRQACALDAPPPVLPGFQCEQPYRCPMAPVCARTLFRNLEKQFSNKEKSTPKP